MGTGEAILVKSGQKKAGGHIQLPDNRNGDTPFTTGVKRA